MCQLYTRALLSYLVPMPTHPVLVALADALCDRRKGITERWVEALHANPELPSASMVGHSGLLDHLPKLFDNLTDQLRAGDDLGPRAAAAANARAHGEHRWQQDYRLDELLREISLLRRMFIDELVPYREQHPEFHGTEEWLALRIIHTFFDRLIIDSAAQFMEQQESHLGAATRSLQRAHDETKAANARLRELDAQRLRMLRTISHELRNVLGGMQTATQSLSEENEEAARQKLFLMLSRNLAQMTCLAGQLLDFATLLSGGEKVRVEAFNPVLLFEELVLSTHSIAVAKGLRFCGTLDPSLERVVSDEHKIQRIATNLLTNAVKYCSSGHVLLDFRSADEERWRITVTDTGEGIPADQHEKIFREFHRLPGAWKSPGAGLGLAITRQLVELLGGTIAIQSEVGQGSVFTVTLPKRIEG